MSKQDAAADYSAPLTKDNAHELRRLCRVGMLFGVQDWIRAGKSTVLAGNPTDSPLALAAGKGFHSLVQLLLEQAQPKDCLDAALTAALVGGNVDTVVLLLQRGAAAKELDTHALFGSQDVELLRGCITAGVDLSTNTPLARELVSGSETALRFLERWHSEIATVRDQGDMALISAVRDNNEYWAQRLIDAGASPRRRVPELSSRYEIGYATTALEKAARCGTFRMLLLLGPRKSDDLRELMKNVCWDFDLPKMKMLLKRGFKLNDKNGGSSVLQMCLEGTGILVFRCNSERAAKAWEAAVELAEMGARWVPDPREMFLVRCGLRHTVIETWMKVAAVLLRTGAADHATLGKLFGSPWMRAHLRYCRGEEAMATILGPKWWQPKRGRRER